jgi:uroporphyrinogen decarboxylase
VYDYPGHVVNCNARLTGASLALTEIPKLFKRPFMGGMDRHGILATGTRAQVEAEITQVVRSAPKQFILGADCTVAADTDWNRIQHAIATAHRVGA